MSKILIPLKKKLGRTKIIFKNCQTLNMLIDNVLVLLVGLDLLDEEFQSAAVSLEQHNSHARTRHPRRDWLEVRREVPWRGPGLGPHPGLPLVGGRALPSPPTGRTPRHLLLSTTTRNRRLCWDESVPVGVSSHFRSAPEAISIFGDLGILSSSAVSTG